MGRSFARLPGPSALGAPSALILGAWEIEAPAPVVAALQLGMDEAVDGLMADDLVSNIAREAPRHLLGRPALREPTEDSLAQAIVARSEEGRVGKECVSTWRTWWTPTPSQK